MTTRFLSALLCPLLVAVAAWVGNDGAGKKHPNGWTEIPPGVLRSNTPPYSYALVHGKAALVIDAAHKAGGLKRNGVERIETVLLTHHHRDTGAAVGHFRAAGVPVRAAESAA